MGKTIKKLSSAQVYLLQALLSGATLKAHRYFDGTKLFKLHTLHRPPEVLDRAVVESLKRQKLLESNKKFPVATYLLTDRGRALAATLAETGDQPGSAGACGASN